MKKKITAILILLLFLFIAFFAKPVTVSAQPQYECMAQYNPVGKNRCLLQPQDQPLSRCPAGYQNPPNCSQWDEWEYNGEIDDIDCIGPHDCQPLPTATPTPSPGPSPTPTTGPPAPTATPGLPEGCDWSQPGAGPEPVCPRAGFPVLCATNPNYCCPSEDMCPEPDYGNCLPRVDPMGPCPDGYPEGCAGTNYCCKQLEDCDAVWQFEGKIFCTVGNDTKGGINTALGCIPVKYTGLASWVLTLSFGIGGGVAFLLMLIGGFQVITASGNPKKVQAGRQLLTSAISGLILIIFSIFILRIIGLELFQIPGLQ